MPLLALSLLSICAQHGGALGENQDLISPFGYDAPDFIANVGDFDGKGRDEVMVCRGTNLRIVSADMRHTHFISDAQFLYGETQAPQGVVRLGDLNGDGREELALSFRFEAHDHSNKIWIPECDRGRVHFVDGATLLPFKTITGKHEHSRLGKAMSTFPDQDGDGHREFLLSIPDLPRGGYRRGEVVGFSPVTGHEFFRFSRGITGAGFGEQAFIGADIDGDGRGDLIVGEPNFGGTGHFGKIHAINPWNRHNLWEIESPNQEAEWLGRWMMPADDYDGDGLADFVSAGIHLPYFRGRTYAFSSADGSVIWQANERRADIRFGKPIMLTPDLNGDHLQEVMVGSDLNGGCLQILSSVDGHMIMEVNSGPKDGHYNWDTHLEENVIRVDTGHFRFMTVEHFGATSDIPHIRVFSHYHGLRISPSEVNRNETLSIRFHIGMPSRFAGYEYVILASLAGDTGRFYDGVGIPLDHDWLFTEMQGAPRPGFLEQHGHLDAGGSVEARLDLPGPLWNLPVGRVYVSALIRDPVTQKPVVATRSAWFDIVE